MMSHHNISQKINSQVTYIYEAWRCYDRIVIVWRFLERITQVPYEFKGDHKQFVVKISYFWNAWKFIESLHLFSTFSKCFNLIDRWLFDEYQRPALSFCDWFDGIGRKFSIFLKSLQQSPENGLEKMCAWNNWIIDDKVLFICLL